MKTKIILALLIFATTHLQGQYCNDRTTLMISTGINYSTYNEFGVGLEFGIIPKDFPVYITIGGICYTAKKDPQKQWTTAEIGGRVYGYKKISPNSSIHLFGQLRWVTQGGERNGINQLSPGIGTNFTHMIGNKNNSQSYLKYELEKTFFNSVERFRFGVSFVGVL